MHLDLTLEQINVIMQALGNAPFVQVEALINEIRKQVFSEDGYVDFLVFSH